MLPKVVKSELEAYLGAVKRFHEDEIRLRQGYVKLPGALANKYQSAEREWA